MSIHKIGSDLIRPFGPKGPGGVERKSDGESNTAHPARPDRSDRVGFSAEGLALAERAQSIEADLSAERLGSIETRIAERFYDDPEVAQEVAQRLKDSGDL